MFDGADRAVGLGEPQRAEQVVAAAVLSGVPQPAELRDAHLCRAPSCGPAASSAGCTSTAAFTTSPSELISESLFPH